MKKYILAIHALILIVLLAPCISQATVTVTPSSVNVVRGQTNTVVITYRFSGILDLPYMTSAEGRFLVGATLIERNNLPLTAIISGGIGTVTETVVLPVKIIERVLQQGTAQFSSYNHPDIVLLKMG